MEPQFNEVAGDQPNWFVKLRIDGLLYRGSFSYILLLLGQRIPFVMSRFLLNSSLNRGSTVSSEVLGRHF